MSDASAENFSPSVFSRHLDELEELQSGGASFDDNQHSDEESSDTDMEWRRQLVEESYTRVKQAKARTLDPKKVYEPGTLLFDTEQNKFGRVMHSQAGYLVVEFVRGGQQVYGQSPEGSEPLDLDAVMQKSTSKTVRRSKGNGASTANKAVSKKATAKPKSASKVKAADIATAAGISDINSYIKDNFQTLSNREMARQIGLSEHTIRRKLGEWGLKRDKR